MTGDTFSDGEERELWERTLTTPSENRFREFFVDRLNPSPDESVLSVGCGPGFETAALARKVSEGGRITGVDLNGEVLAAARERCGDLPQVWFGREDVTELPVADESYGIVVPKQVLPGVSDVGAGLNELHRVVESNGRVAVTAGDRRTHVTHTPTDRTQRADRLYRSEMGEQQLGTRLVGLLPGAGFEVEDIIPRAKIETGIDDQVERGIELQRELLEAADSFDEAEVEAWERESRELDEAGRFLSCGTALLYVARKIE